MSRKVRGQAEFQRWMGPLLDCLRALGGAAKPAEVSRWIAEHLKLGPEITETSLKSGANRFHNQVQWARQYLVWEGLIDDAKRGTWKLTPLGWKTRLDEAEARTIFLDRVRLQQAERSRGADADRDGSGELSNPQQLIDSAPPPDEQPEEDLLKVLKSLSAGGFERLCKRHAP